MIDLLDVTTRLSGDRVTITIRGELDLETAPDLTAAFDAAFASGVRHITADLSKLDFCDSSGLQAFIAANRRCSDTGVSFAILPPEGQPLAALELSGLADVLPVRPSAARRSASTRRLLLVI